MIDIVMSCQLFFIHILPFKRQFLPGLRIKINLWAEICRWPLEPSTGRVKVKEIHPPALLGVSGVKDLSVRSIAIGPWGKKQSAPMLQSIFPPPTFVHKYGSMMSRRIGHFRRVTTSSGRKMTLHMIIVLRTWGFVRCLSCPFHFSVFDMAPC